MDNPFESKARALKTILSVDKNISLYAYMMNKNKGIPRHMIYECFHDLYKKDPDGFTLEINLEDLVTLYYMGRGVRRMSVFVHKIKNVDDFFEVWNKRMKYIG